jgi:hypothetical protein
LYLSAWRFVTRSPIVHLLRSTAGDLVRVIPLEEYIQLFVRRRPRRFS